MKTLQAELRRTFEVTRWVFSIYFKNYPVLISIYIFTELILSFSSLFNAYIIALVTDKAIRLTQIGTSDIKDFVPIIVLISGSYLITQILSIINNQIWSVIDYQNDLHLRMMHAERLAVLGIQNLENPDIANKSQRFNEER